MSKERIIKALEGKDKIETEKELLEEFGFIYISDFMVRADGTICVDIGIGDTYEIDFELWIDYKNKRALLYSPYDYLNFIDGQLTEEEEKIYYPKNDK